jgi:hypothetical protein
MLPLLLLLCLLPVGDASSDRTNHLLSTVSRIFIQKDGLAGMGVRESNKFPIVELLRQELSERGYVIVADSSEADAILRGTYTVQITLDEQDPRNPDYHRYKFDLITNTNERLWKTTVTITASKVGPREAEKKASALIINRLDKAIKSARRKAE